MQFSLIFLMLKFTWALPPLLSLALVTSLPLVPSPPLPCPVPVTFTWYLNIMLMSHVHIYCGRGSLVCWNILGELRLCLEKHSPLRECRGPDRRVSVPCLIPEYSLKLSRTRQRKFNLTLCRVDMWPSDMGRFHNCRNVITPANMMTLTYWLIWCPSLIELR